MHLSSDWRFKLSLTGLLLSVWNVVGQTATLDRFVWQIAGPAAATGKAFPATLRAKTADGLDVPAYQGSVRLTVWERLPAAGVLFTEFSPARRSLELMNVNSESVDISGWRIESAALGATGQRFGFAFPPGTVIPEGGVFQVSPNLSDTSGSYPFWYWGSPLRYWSSRGANGLAAWLFDGQGRPVDIVCVGAADPARLSEWEFVPYWRGPTLVLHGH